MLAGKQAATTKRPSATREQPPSKKSKGFTTKKKTDNASAPKAYKPLKVYDSSVIIPFMGEVAPTSTPPIVKQPEEADNIKDKFEMAKEITK